MSHEHETVTDVLDEMRRTLLEAECKTGDKDRLLELCDAIERAARLTSRTLPTSIQEALNSGDGAYRP